eukprot:11221349-Lingulodinium_polyedra.AAC.1
MLQTLHANAVESPVRRSSGSLVARSRVPRARQFSGARVECASVRLASRAADGRFHRAEQRSSSAAP